MVAQVVAGRKVGVVHQVVGPGLATQGQAQQQRGQAFHGVSLAYCTTTLTVRVVPWLLVMVAVGAAVGTAVVLLLTARRQRPVTGTVVVPRSARRWWW
jgi:hypothetical protein